MKWFDLKVGDCIVIGDTRIVIEEKSGRRCRLGIQTSDPAAIGVKKADRIHDEVLTA